MTALCTVHRQSACTILSSCLSENVHSVLQSSPCFLFVATSIYLRHPPKLFGRLIRPSAESFLIFDVILSLISWLLYEKPGFQGRVIALEEGPTEHIVNIWAQEETPPTVDQTDQPVPTAPVVIGSIRLAVRVGY